MQVRFLGQEDSLEESTATHSSILAWRIPMDREAWWGTLHRVAKSQTKLKRLSTHAHLTITINSPNQRQLFRVKLPKTLSYSSKYQNPFTNYINMPVFDNSNDHSSLENSKQTRTSVCMK